MEFDTYGTSFFVYGEVCNLCFWLLELFACMCMVFDIDYF